MELTRREAAAALAAAGITVGGAALVGSEQWRDRLPVGSPDEATLDSLVALAEVLYPSEVTVEREFVETYVLGRSADDPDYREEMEAGLDVLDRQARGFHDEAFAALTVEQRDRLLRGMELVDAEPVPDGTEVQRMRYYLVNDLLFALFTTPTGGELVGAENPRGYPGGLDAYQRGPQE